MPLYEYECVKCAHRFEKIEKHSAPHLQKCPKCGGKAERQLGAPAIQFKGSGWYVTDYARKTSGGDAKAEKSSKPAETKETKESAPAKDAAKKEHKNK